MLVISKVTSAISTLLVTTQQTHNINDNNINDHSNIND